MCPYPAGELNASVRGHEGNDNPKDWRTEVKTNGRGRRDLDQDGARGGHHEEDKNAKIAPGSRPLHSAETR